MNTLKPTLLLLLGCLPLAALTVSSFAGVGAVRDELPRAGAEDVLVPLDVPAKLGAEQLAGDEAICAELAQRELLAGEAAALQPENAPEPLYLATLDENWRNWSDAYALVDQVLVVEDNLPSPSAMRLASDKNRLRRAADEIAQIQTACRQEIPTSGTGLLRTLERRRTELQDQIDRIQRNETARRRILDGDTALAAQDYAASVRHYDDVLATYADALSADELTAVRRNRQRTQFLIDSKRLEGDLADTELLPRQRDLVRDFLAAHDGGAYLLPSDQAAIASYRTQLLGMEAELREQAMNRAAARPIERLAIYDGRSFAEGVARAAQIAADHPTDEVRNRLQAQVSRWMLVSLPTKVLAEPVGIEEIETHDGRVVRGFFAPVPGPGNEIIGYKRYDSAAERKNPTRSVGRYPAADLTGPPQPSIPQRCIQAYAAARQLALNDPSHRANWAELAGLCRRLDEGLIDYRRIPGSSRESLAFDGEAQFGETVLQPETWTHIQAIWGQ